MGLLDLRERGLEGLLAVCNCPQQFLSSGRRMTAGSWSGETTLGGSSDKTCDQWSACGQPHLVTILLWTSHYRTLVRLNTMSPACRLSVREREVRARARLRARFSCRAGPPPATRPPCVPRAQPGCAARPRCGHSHRPGDAQGAATVLLLAPHQTSADTTAVGPNPVRVWPHVSGRCHHG